MSYLEPFNLDVRHGVQRVCRMRDVQRGAEKKSQRAGFIRQSREEDAGARAFPAMMYEIMGRRSACDSPPGQLALGLRPLRVVFTTMSPARMLLTPLVTMHHLGVYKRPWGDLVRRDTAYIDVPRF